MIMMNLGNGANIAFWKISGMGRGDSNRPPRLLGGYGPVFNYFCYRSTHIFKMETGLEMTHNACVAFFSLGTGNLYCTFTHEIESLG